MRIIDHRMTFFALGIENSISYVIRAKLHHEELFCDKISRWYSSSFMSKEYDSENHFIELEMSITNKSVLLITLQNAHQFTLSCLPHWTCL